MCSKLFLTLSVLFLAPCEEDELVQYYVNIIENGTAHAFNTELPTNAYKHMPHSDEVSDCGEFDHIIVGAGSAGAIVANRLSEDETQQILLVEAGGDETDFGSIPGMMAFLQGSEYNWNYITTPQRNACLGFRRRQCKYPRGKGLGGSSLTNGLMYVRGNKQDYDKWFSYGNDGWSYKNVLPYFKKFEHFLNGGSEYHGMGGSLNVQTVDPTSPQANAFFEANNEMGYKLIDYNGKEQIGYGKVYLNIINGKRHGTNRAFLNPIKNRKNLKIRRNSFVTKVLINRDKRACGIEYSKDGKMCKAKSKKDIILSAGAIGSPQILMLSGIGPKSHLEELKIKVKQDLEVGCRLIDHPVFTNLEFTTNYSELNTVLEESVREFVQEKGILLNSFNVQGVSFVDTKDSSHNGYPDIEILMTPSPISYEVSANFFDYSEEVYKSLVTGGNTLQNFNLLVIGLHPLSTGTLKLLSNNSYDYPEINPNFLEDENDVRTIYEGIKFVLKLINTNAFKKLDTKLRYINFLPCEQYEYLSQAYWYCRIKYFTNSGYHPIGTCKMGPDPKYGAVVNHKLQVHGIDNLRIADASVIPSPISGHTNAASIMIGERVSDFIKKDN